MRLHKLETNLGSFRGTSAVKVTVFTLLIPDVNFLIHNNHAPNSKNSDRKCFGNGSEPSPLRRALEAFYKHDKPEAYAGLCRCRD